MLANFIYFAASVEVMKEATAYRRSSLSSLGCLLAGKGLAADCLLYQGSKGKYICVDSLDIEDVPCRRNKGEMSGAPQPSSILSFFVSRTYSTNLPVEFRIV